MIMFVAPLVCAFPIACLVGGIVLIMTARPRSPVAHGGPACGNCGYNLAGSTSVNRCPECGKLFIEAGIVRGGPARWRRGQLAAGIILAGTPALLMLLGMFLVLVPRPSPHVHSAVAHPSPVPATAPSGSGLLPEPADPAVETQPSGTDH